MPPSPQHARIKSKKREQKDGMAKGKKEEVQ